MWLNNTQVIAFSGNPCTDSATSLNAVEFASVDNTGGSGGCGTSGTCWSEMILANEDTRSMHVATLAPQGSGPTQAWTPNTLANINKATINDASFVATSTANQISQWTAPTTAPTGIWGVKSVIFNARLLVNTTGPQNGEFIAHVSGSDYTSLCTNPTLTNAFANYNCQMDNSPATSTTWGISEVYNTSANQLIYGIESLP